MLWLVSMGWLIAEKVAPPLLVGERPPVLAEDAAKARVPVAWQLLLDNQPLGWASTDTVERPDQILEMRNRVHLDRLPVREIAPWLARMFDPDGRDGQMPFDTDSRVELDDGKLLGFRTSITLGDVQDAILVHGTVEDQRLQLTVRAGNFAYNTATDLYSGAMVGDALSPRPRLSQLRVGQTWTEPVYNPLHPPNSPVQIMQATVQRREPIGWNRQIVNAFVVLYQNDAGAEGPASTARARAWVAEDGTVLKQEVSLLGVKLLFVRLPPGQTVERLRELEAIAP
jgi:hypothetical protein